MADHVAHAETEISASPDQVWDALTDPEAISTFMFGSQVETDWQVGSPITWTGEWNGKPFHDTGQVRKVLPNRELMVTHFNHVVTFDLEPVDGGTEVTVSQTNAATEEEKKHSEANWANLLQTLKGIAERSRQPQSIPSARQPSSGGRHRR